MTFVQLSQWLYSTVDETWQSPYTRLRQQSNLGYCLRQTDELDRSSVQRVKVLNLGEQTIWLLVSLKAANSSDRIAVRVQLCSAERDAVLPIGLSLTLCSDCGDVVQSVIARDRDNIIQLKRFRCSIGTQFSLQILLEPICLTENFSV